MITITNREMIVLLGALREMSGMEMSPRLSFWVAKTARDIDGVFQVYDEQRIALLEQYALRDEDGKYVIDGDDGQSIKVSNEFWEKHAELLDSKGPDVRPIGLSVIESGLPKGSLSVNLATALLPVVDYEA